MKSEVGHLRDSSVSINPTEAPTYYSSGKLPFERLFSLREESAEKAKYAPIQILKGGLQLINSYNLSEIPIPRKVIKLYGLEESEVIVRRAFAAKYVLGLVSEVLDLPDGHLSVEASKKYVEVHRNGKSRSAIMPTYLGNGVKFTIPHDDYMYGLDTGKLPRLRLGENTYVSANVRLDIGGDLNIGDRVFIGRDTHRLGHVHDPNFPGIVRETMVATKTDYRLRVGDDALIGYEVDLAAKTSYIGENAIIGQRSTVTTPWVGDFSILVGNNRTIGYLPTQAYFKYQYPDAVNVETMAAIDWNGALEEEWQTFFKRRYATMERQIMDFTNNDSIKKQPILVLGRTNNIPQLAGYILNGDTIDYVTDDLQDHAFLLQLAKNCQNFNVRLRTGISYFLENKPEKYSIIIDNT